MQSADASASASTTVSLRIRSASAEYRSPLWGLRFIVHLRFKACALGHVGHLRCSSLLGRSVFPAARRLRPEPRPVSDISLRLYRIAEDRAGWRSSPTSWTVGIARRALLAFRHRSGVRGTRTAARIARRRRQRTIAPGRRRCALDSAATQNHQRHLLSAPLVQYVLQVSFCECC